MRLAEPGWLALLLLVPLPWLLARPRSRIAWPSLAMFGPKRGRLRPLKAHLPHLLRGLAIASLAVALARPQSVGGRTRIAGQGVAIVIALDHSSSMNAPDFPESPNGQPIARLDAARQTLERFVDGRPDDLLGLVVFANYPDLASPPTLDHAFLLDAVRAIRPARPGDDGTNLGDAMVWGLDALRKASPPRKVLVLLTDGRNSPAVPHPTDPLQAARLAARLGVTVHTIAVGRGAAVIQAVEPLTELPVSAEVEGPDLPLLESIVRAGNGALVRRRRRRIARPCVRHDRLPGKEPRSRRGEDPLS